nr:reverse transcriptase domain-containing protein [Tanacetum cinerariifolium]
MAKLPMVTAPKPKEELIMYLCAAREAVRAVLLAERDLRQIPIYFVSRALQTLEINYSSMEKLVLAVVHATRRLRRYFQAYPVVVITDQPIKQILSRLENTRRMLKWIFELEVFDITYRPRISIRGQILADFIAEKPDEEGPSMEEFTYALRFEFNTSNNEAEYEALVAGLRISEQIGVKNLIAKVDSRLVANQINGQYEAKEQSMTQYMEKAKTLINNFKMFSIEQVPRSENKKADALSKIAPMQAEYVVKEIHEGSCSMHSDPRSMVEKQSGPNITGRQCTKMHGTSSGNAKNDEELLLNLDILKERKEKAAAREARNKAKMESTTTQKLTAQASAQEILSTIASHAKESEKLGPKWERPYEVIEALGKGAYKLRDGSGDVLPRMWNVQDLKKCYL